MEKKGKIKIGITFLQILIAILRTVRTKIYIYIYLAMYCTLYYSITQEYQTRKIHNDVSLPVYSILQ